MASNNQYSLNRPSIISQNEVDEREYNKGLLIEAINQNDYIDKTKEKAGFFKKI